MASETQKPRAEIRRFDVFAEWNRLKARTRHHLPEPDARAYGLAVAKVVAARKFYGYQPAQVSEWKRRARHDEMADAWWEHLGSNEEFENKIVGRMGKTFYKRVFQPAIKRAWDAGSSYELIRDRLREEWNSARTTKKKAGKGK